MKYSNILHIFHLFYLFVSISSFSLSSPSDFHYLHYDFTNTLILIERVKYVNLSWEDTELLKITTIINSLYTDNQNTIEKILQKSTNRIENIINDLNELVYRGFSIMYMKTHTEIEYETLKSSFFSIENSTKQLEYISKKMKTQFDESKFEVNILIESYLLFINFQIKNVVRDFVHQKYGIKYSSSKIIDLFNESLFLMKEYIVFTQSNLNNFHSKVSLPLITSTTRATQDIVLKLNSTYIQDETIIRLSVKLIMLNFAKFITGVPFCGFTSMFMKTEKYCKQLIYSIGRKEAPIFLEIVRQMQEKIKAHHI